MISRADAECVAHPRNPVVRVAAFQTAF